MRTAPIPAGVRRSVSTGPLVGEAGAAGKPHPRVARRLADVRKNWDDATRHCDRSHGRRTDRLGYERDGETV